MHGASFQRRSRHRHTYDEYLAYERDSGLKHEFEDGEIFAMAGGSRRHNALASRLSAVLEATRKPGCNAFPPRPRVECYRRLVTGAWEYRVTTEGTLQLLSGAALDIVSLYADLPD